MDKQKLLSLARAVLEQPTAPFHEDAVAAEILRQLASCPHVQIERDAFGNIVARYQRGTAEARYAFAAHMDHPGWVGGEFLGGVPAEYLREPQTQDFGEFAMWDLRACEVRDEQIHARACDDLIGCVTILALFRELEATSFEGACVGLFTRAEEVGFVGAIQLAQSGLLPKSLTIISLETSSERPPARMGGGPIIRVGDRTSIFDSAATAALVAAAQRAHLTVQRCLMSGGTCEATAYQLYGYTSAGLCLALGHYHNCGPDHQIAAEFISIDDFAGLVQLCVAITRDPSPPGAAEIALREKLAANLQKYARYC